MISPINNMMYFLILKLFIGVKLNVNALYNYFFSVNLNVLNCSCLRR